MKAENKFGKKVEFNPNRTVGYYGILFTLIFVVITSLLMLADGEHMKHSLILHWLVIVTALFPAACMTMGIIFGFPRLVIFPDHLHFINLFGFKRLIPLKGYGKPHVWFTNIERLWFRITIPEIGFVERKKEKSILSAGKRVTAMKFDARVSLAFIVPHDQAAEVVEAIAEVRRNEA